MTFATVYNIYLWYTSLPHHDSWTLRDRRELLESLGMFFQGVTVLVREDDL